jgi:cell division ATPase FtsA
VLEKVWVKVLVEAVFIFDWRFVPVDLVGKGNLCVEVEAHLVFGSEVHVHNFVAVVAYVKLLVRPDEVAHCATILFTLTNNTYGKS